MICTACSTVCNLERLKEKMKANYVTNETNDGLVDSHFQWVPVGTPCGRTKNSIVVASQVNKDKTTDVGNKQQQQPRDHRPPRTLVCSGVYMTASAMEIEALKAKIGRLEQERGSVEDLEERKLIRKEIVTATELLMAVAHS